MKRILACITVAITLCLSQQTSAQWFTPLTTTHYHNVPHTETHIDYYQHGNHVDAVPHTTTHIDQVPHTTSNFGYTSQYPISGGQIYQSNRPVITQGHSYGQYGYSNQGQYNYSNQSHLAYPNQGGGYYSGYGQPYQSFRPATPYGQPSTHIDFVPHTETHIDYYQHGNHIDAVPHTTTHIDAIPHTTGHFHYGR